jgi:hypothetical protein
MSKNTLQQMMYEDMPGLTYQKRQAYRTSHREIVGLFKLLNKEIFNNRLPLPEFRVLQRSQDYWGMCAAKHFVPTNNKRSNCVITLNNKWYCKQWLIMTLAHEMCHQYQWDVISFKRQKEGKKPLMSHGPSFFIFRDRLAKHGIPLRRAHSIRKWFKHQNLFKC